MKRLFTVIGLGRFGYSVAQTMVEKGCEVLEISNFRTEGDNGSNHLPFSPSLKAPTMNQVITETLENHSEKTFTANLESSKSYYWKVGIKTLFKRKFYFPFYKTVL